jgi:hypothetical protein
MTTTIRNAAATAGLLAALALPLTAQAATTTTTEPQRYTLQTRYFDQYHAGEYDGSLALTIYPGGIVQGTYRLDGGSFRTVTGGLDAGNRIWLDIGDGAFPLHLSGTFRDGALETVASTPGPDRFTLESITPKHG